MRIISFAWGGTSSRALYEENLRLQAEIAQMRLDHVRWARDIIEHFRLGLDSTDEDTLRYGLDAALIDLKDEVARMEEHSGI